MPVNTMNLSDDFRTVFPAVKSDWRATGLNCGKSSGCLKKKECLRAKLKTFRDTYLTTILNHTYSRSVQELAGPPHANRDGALPPTGWKARPASRCERGVLVSRAVLGAGCWPAHSKLGEDSGHAAPLATFSPGHGQSQSRLPDRADGQLS
jgi:hypothetical protein